MLFNSLAFLVFLPLVFLTYWYVFGRSLRGQNAFLLVASYVFYGWWDPRFLLLLFGSSVGDLVLGRAIEQASTQARRKFWLTVSIVVNLTLLGFFKYFNFFADGLHDLLLGMGFESHLPTLRVLLPVGISFYTFQSLSYTIDIYRRRIQATRDPLAFMAFVSFFPQLVAGPIERAANLLPQFVVLRRFEWDAARDGLRRMLWGFFKKIVIADNCAPLADGIFNSDPATTPGITLFFGAFFFAFQIYGDFSGYSDIAIGCARLFGLQLSQNFAYPYFSRNIQEFWRRWHISLSSWFRDYLYIPLGGYRSRWGRLRNVLITFTTSGLWHGANWTFVGWGALHGSYFIPQIMGGTKQRRDDAVLKDLPQILITFLLVTIAWVFFRSPTVHAALDHLRYMVLNAGDHPGAALLWILRPEMVLIILLLAVEWRSRRDAYAIVRLPANGVARWTIYLAIALMVLVNVDLRTPHAFIYFQF